MATGIATPTASAGVTIYGTPVTGGTPTRAIKCVFSRTRSTTTAAINQTNIISVLLIEIDGNDADYHRLLDECELDIDDTTLANNDRNMPNVSPELWITLRVLPYDSTSAATQAATGWIEGYHRGVRIFRLSPKDSIHPNSTGNDYGGTWTLAGSSKWHGVAVEGGQYTTRSSVSSGTPSGLAAKAFAARFVRRSSASTPPINVGSSDVVAFSADRVDTGTLDVDPTLDEVTAFDGSATTTLEGREVQTTTMLTSISAAAGYPTPSPNAPRNYVLAVDGTNAIIVNPVEGTYGNWQNVTGTSTFGKCRVIARYRGRIFLANYDGNPSFWALTKVGDITNLTTGGSDPTRAFTGTASDSPGVPADAITCAAPFQDDYLFIGCSKSCYYMSGDPGYGGRLLLLSDQTGVFGPRAFCFDEEGNLYFLGAGGLFIIQKGTLTPKNISGRRLASVLDQVNSETTLAQMVYDSATAMVHVFLTPRDGASAGLHVSLDIRQNAFWLDEYPASFGPTAAKQIVGQSYDGRRFIFGGFDGYIRRPRFGAKDDDGSAIDSWVRYPIVEFGNGGNESIVTEIQAVGVQGTQGVTYEVRTAPSASQVMRADIDGRASTDATGVWFETQDGFQDPVGLRQTGGAHQMIVRHDSTGSTWGIERILMQIKPVSRRRLN